MIGVGKIKQYSNVLDKPLSKSKQEGNRRETHLLGILSFIHNTVWKVLFGKVHFNPKRYGTFNYGASVAGIVRVLHREARLG
ncbi:hypothetical protein SLA2020_425250 [Shorea laevis]